MRLHVVQLLRLHRLLFSKPARALRKQTPMDLTGNHLPIVGLHNRTIPARKLLSHSGQWAANRPAPFTIPK
jgi:hypothetical protein